MSNEEREYPYPLLYESGSDTTFKPTSDDFNDLNSTITSVSSMSLNSEDEFVSDIPPLTMSEINNMPAVTTVGATDCPICWTEKYNFIPYTCCQQLICRECSIEWLLIREGSINLGFFLKVATSNLEL